MDLHQNDRQALLQRILDAVKQCQVTFGGKSILATEKDSSVSCLVSQFEQALQHGIKKNKLIEKISNSLTEPLRQVTQKIIPEIDLTFWSVVKDVLGPMDIKHFDSMQGINTDAGRARSWLRCSLNEHSLERHLNAVLADKNLINQFYEPWALLRDDEISSTLPIMARGLSSIIFAMEVKSEELNAPFKTYTSQSNQATHRRVPSNPLPVFAGFDTEPAIVKKINNMKKKKKKRKVMEATITNLDDDLGEERYSRSYSEDSDYTRQHNDDDNHKNQKTTSAPVSPRTFMSSDENDSQSESELFQAPYKHNDGVSDALNGATHSTPPETSSVTFPSITPPSSTPPLNSGFVPVAAGFNESVTNTTTNHGNGRPEHVLSTPVDDERDGSNSDLTSLVPEQSRLQLDHPGKNDSILRDPSPLSLRSDEMEVGSESTKYHQLFMSYDQESSQAASDAMALITSFEPTHSLENSHSFDHVFKPIGESSTPPTAPSNLDKYIPNPNEMKDVSSNDLSAVDLKQAILATAKKKDEVEERNKVLQCALDEQRELVNVLEAENQKLESESKDREAHDQKKIMALNREIEVLKNQLKKYVAAVQTLRRDHAGDPTLPDLGNLRLNDEDVAVPSKERERTTSENDSIFEDKLAQMAEMHGELLEFQEKLQRQLACKESFITRMKQELIALRGPLPDEISKDPDSIHTSQESVYAASRPLINIWIPSVFLKGKGTDAHHLYQIYVRVGDEEWNIYRRYSQFNKLHIQMCKMYTSLEKFNFPKKKMFKKKDLKFVEDRRRKLQEYLRLLINTTLSINTELASEPNKSLLVKHISFFGENFDASDDKKRKQKKQENDSPVYTGLVSFPEI